METASAIRQTDAAWRSSITALIVLVASVLLLYRETAASMVAIWSRSETFTHGFVVPPIALWLAWRERARVAAEAPRPLPWILLPIAGVGFLWLLGDVAVVNAASQFALIAMLVLLVPAVAGWRVARILAFPLGFLFFAVPIGEFLMPQFMQWTADFTVAALRLTGIPVFREGLQFVIPSGSWSVVEACSGIRYLIATTMVGTLFAYLNYRSMSRRLAFVAVSILVSIVANWLRAYFIVLLGHYSDNALAAGADHLIYGWIFFGIVVGVLFAIGARWSEPFSAPSTRSAERIAVRPTASMSMRLVVVSALFIAALPHAAAFALNSPEDRTDLVLDQLDLAHQDWFGSERVTADYTPAFENPVAVIHRTYLQEGRAVGLYIAYYRDQRPHRKLISANNVLVKSTRAAWSRVGSGSHRIEFQGGPLDVRTARLRSNDVAGGDRRLAVWQFYWVNGTLTASDSRAKAWGAVHRLLGRGDDGAAVIIYAPEAQSGAADLILEDFVRSNLPAIEVHLRKARDGH